MVVLAVIKAFTHEGHAFSAGETITVAPVVAVALHRRGVVSLSRVAPSRTKALEAEPVPDPAPAPEPAPRRRRTYRRRDLVAES